MDQQLSLENLAVIVVFAFLAGCSSVTAGGLDSGFLPRSRTHAIALKSCQKQLS